ncbi:MAG: hypothetical protein AAGA30_15480, partial [Planctomycetota bacterium]
KTKSSGQLPLDIVFESKGGKTTFQLMHKTKPATDCEFFLIDEKDETHEFTTDSDGKVVFDRAPSGQWLIRAKATDAEGGEHNGEKYNEKRYYCTLVLGNKAAEKTETKAELSISGTPVNLTMPFPELPVGITSFGGAMVKDQLYVYGGHCGRAHDYYQSGQNAKLYCLNTNSQSAEWEVVSDTVGSQGLAMVSHKNDLYRLGGFTAKNKQGEKHDLHSSDEFSKFDFELKKWKQLQPMPVARSSFDAVVVEDTLYVIGGWTMKGRDQETEWCDNFLTLSLADDDANWETHEIPFKRRALSVGFQGDKIYVVGGMRQRGGPTSEVKVYDMKTGAWSDGPELLGGKGMEGFGSSCFNIGGRLVASTYGGSVLRLDEAGEGWEKLHELEIGRFFHRLLPLDGEKFMLVGGANMEAGKLYDIEVFSFN